MGFVKCSCNANAPFCPQARGAAPPAGAHPPAIRQPYRPRARCRARQAGACREHFKNANLPHCASAARRTRRICAPARAQAMRASDSCFSCGRTRPDSICLAPRRVATRPAGTRSCGAELELAAEAPRAHQVPLTKPKNCVTRTRGTVRDECATQPTHGV